MNIDERLTEVTKGRLISLASSNAAGPLVVAALRDLRDAAKRSGDKELELYTTLYNEIKEMIWANDDEWDSDSCARIVRLVLGGKDTATVDKAMKKVAKRKAAKTAKTAKATTQAPTTSKGAVVASTSSGTGAWGPPGGPPVGPWAYPGPFQGPFPGWPRPPGPGMAVPGRQPPRCYGCGEIGHIRRVCPRFTR